MRKFIKQNNSEIIAIFEGSDLEYARKNGFEEVDIEIGYDHKYYLPGQAPSAPELTYSEKRLAAYPPITEQLDMLYWDKINNTSTWTETINKIKQQYPKE